MSHEEPGTSAGNGERLRGAMIDPIWLKNTQVSTKQRRVLWPCGKAPPQARQLTPPYLLGFFPVFSVVSPSRSSERYADAEKVLSPGCPLESPSATRDAT